jgi:hypothetical protein
MPTAAIGIAPSANHDVGIAKFTIGIGYGCRRSPVGIDVNGRLTVFPRRKSFFYLNCLTFNF